jgi:trimeric autotransporter adhesin
LKQIRKRVTYANVMSSIAVFLVLGGGAALAAGLAKNSVGSKQLKKNAVTETKIKNGVVTSGKIADGSIVTAKLADGSVVTGKIVNAAVTSDKLGDGSVVAIKLGDGAVTTVKLTDDAVTAAKIAANAVGSSEIAASSVGANELGDKLHEHTASGNANDVTALNGDWTETALITASCAAGEELVGVASTWTSGGDELATQQLNPNFSAESVGGIGISDDGGTATFQVTAVCSS